MKKKEAEVKYLDDYEDEGQESTIELEEWEIWYGAISEQEEYDKNITPHSIRYSEEVTKVNYTYAINDQVLVVENLHLGVIYWPATIIGVVTKYLRFDFIVRMNYHNNVIEDYVYECELVPYNDKLINTFTINTNLKILKVLTGDLKITRNAFRDTIASMEYELSKYQDDSSLGEYSLPVFIRALKLKFKELKLKEYLGEEAFAREWYDLPIILF